MWPQAARRSLDSMSTDGIGTDGSSDAFVQHRSLLFTVAYEMLGSAADAEDAVQETWLRWAGVDQERVHDPRAYLVQIVTRQALNRLRTVSRRREEYVGEWLPEPLLTSPDVAEDVELAENVSIAMLTVLETLGPVERAVFVLREVFEAPYDEIAEAVGKTPVAVRQIARRAREHVAARRPRMRVDRAQQRAAVEKFMAALTTGNVDALVEVLAPDVVLISDGGGVVQAARKPITGAAKVMSLLALAVKFRDFAATSAWLNGMPGARLTADGAAAAVSLVVEDGRITRIYAIANPHKLTWLDKMAELRR
jgi:RNA polymerase sigma-70 factor (TIGR02957 family)